MNRKVEPCSKGALMRRSGKRFRQRRAFDHTKPARRLKSVLVEGAEGSCASPASFAEPGSKSYLGLAILEGLPC